LRFSGLPAPLITKFFDDLLWTDDIFKLHFYEHAAQTFAAAEVNVDLAIAPCGPATSTSPPP